MKRVVFSLVMFSLAVIAVPGCDGGSGSAQVVGETDKAAIDKVVEQQEQYEAEAMKMLEGAGN